MALTFTEKFRGEFAGEKMKSFEVTCDGSVTTITAGDLDMSYIKAVSVAQKADITGVCSSYDPASIDDGNEQNKDITVTGALLVDFVEGSITLDAADLEVSYDVSAADTITYNIFNRTGAGIDLAAIVGKAIVPKDVGFSTRSGAYIVFAPPLTSADVFMITVIGY